MDAGIQLVDRQTALNEQIKALEEQYNRDYDAFVKNELDTWWAVAGGLVTAVFESADRRVFYESHKAEFEAIEEQQGIRFFFLIDWLKLSCTSTFVRDMPRKVDGAWINVEDCGLYSYGDGKGSICRGVQRTAVCRF